MDLLRNKRAVVYLLAIGFLSCLSILFCNLYSLYKVPIIPLSAPPNIVRIEKYSSAYEFVNQLERNNYIKSTKLFLLIIRLKGITHQLKSGIYQIRPGESAIQFLERVVAGDVLIQHFTIIAGTTQAKVAQDLLQSPYLEYDRKDWDLIKNEYINAEGLLLAETYQYSAQSHSKLLLKKAHQELMSFLNDSWRNRALNLPYKTPYDLLIAASIIEKESSSSQERKIIAGILANRLKKGMPLQMDPTVIYGLKSMGMLQHTLSHNDLKIDSPYNSYRNKGLPPTPIAMVGKDAILAAAHPEDSNFLYFVAKGDGTHQFSETYMQQIQAINRYQRRDS